MTSTATFLVTFDDQPLPADVTALLASAYVDFSLRLPDTFMLRFRDPGRIVVDKSKVRMGTKVKISVATDSTPTPNRCCPVRSPRWRRCSTTPDPSPR